MANLCASYLNFECFSTGLHDNRVQDHANAGAYAFQEYAATNWLYHAGTVLTSNLTVDSGELSALERSCMLLRARHDSRELSVGVFEHEDQNLLVALTRIRESYETVRSISDCEGCENDSPPLV